MSKAAKNAIERRTEVEKTRLAQETVDYLNELFDRDPAAIESLTKTHVDCNSALAEHYSVQVEEVQRAQPTYVVGLLGIINGLIGHRDGIGYIVARFDDETMKLEGFNVTTDAQRQQLKGAPFKKPKP